MKTQDIQIRHNDTALKGVKQNKNRQCDLEICYKREKQTERKRDMNHKRNQNVQNGTILYNYL